MCSTALATLAAPALAYLERYGETLELPIELKSEVKKVEFGELDNLGFDLKPL